MTQRPTPQELEEAKARIAALEAESAELTKALTGLTCGGSEFFIRRGKRYVADIDACVTWVLRAKQDAHRRALDAIKARRVAEDEAAAWKADAATAHLKNQELRASLLEAVGALKLAREICEDAQKDTYMDVSDEVFDKIDAALKSAQKAGLGLILPPPPEHQGGE